MHRMSCIPVTLLTGFLGSGKTTFLNRVLRDERFTRTAIVINEFGDIDLDGLLVEHRLEQIVETTTGCLCCTLRGDVQDTLIDLYDRRHKGMVLPFERLIIETTGLADPDPVIYTIMGDIRLTRMYELAGVVTAIDVIHGEQTLRNHVECAQQAAVADRLLLTKRDLVNNDTAHASADALLGYLKNLNPSAPIIHSNAANFDVARLFDTSLHSRSGRGANVLAWLNSDAYLAKKGKEEPTSHRRKSKKADDPTEIKSYCMTFDEPVDFRAFSFTLQLLMGMKGSDLLRFKGIVNVKGHPNRPIVIHAVQSVVEEPVWLESWPSDDRRTRLVLIGRGIPKASIQNLFESFQGVAPTLDPIAQPA